MKTTLRQDRDNSLSDDGLDCAICCLRPQDKTITYSGARIPLLYRNNGSITFVKGDKHSIGYKDSDLDFSFTNHQISIEPEMYFYLASDGYISQQGGKKGLRFGKRNFIKLLEELDGKSLSEQQQKLIQTFNDYRGSYDTLDDVTVVGFNCGHFFKQ